MPRSPKTPGEKPSTYAVQDRSNREELTRLQVQDQMVTIGMGGVLPEQSAPLLFQQILDVGCGPGGWLIETAKTYPNISRLVGIDISQTMLAFAQEQAATQGVGEKVEFQVMDALQRLAFPDAQFDLVNLRFAQSWLRTWDWPGVLQEFRRITRPGGVIRLTESDFWEGNTPAFQQLNAPWPEAAHRAGLYFTPERTGVTSHLADLLTQHSVQQVQTRAYRLEFRAGTPEGQHFFEDVRLGARTGLPFLRKWGKAPDQYEELYQQMLQEMEQPDFVATWDLLTVWGTRPPEETPETTPSIWTDRGDRVTRAPRRFAKQKRARLDNS
jgi:ubiquinone/menaquinone biosynthesis C-methylase UbiE